MSSADRDIGNREWISGSAISAPCAKHATFVTPDHPFLVLKGLTLQVHIKASFAHPCLAPSWRKDETNMTKITRSTKRKKWRRMGARQR